MANHTSLASLFTDIANAIRAKLGSNASIVADNFPGAIQSIPTGIDGNNIGYGITDGSIPRVGIAKVGSAEIGA